MAITTYEFNKYKLYHYGNDVVAGATVAIMNLYLDAVKVGTIMFYEGTTAPAANTLVSNVITYNCPATRFADVLAIVRYEKPLYINFVSLTSVGYISTGSDEIVGEQEGV